MLDFLFGYSVGAYTTSHTPQPSQSTIPDSKQLELTHRVESLELACAGLWHLLKHHHGYTDDQLVLAIQAVDDMDGVRNGKVNHTVSDCPHCGRRLLTRTSKKCAWCGGEVSQRPFQP